MAIQDHLISVKHRISGVLGDAWVSQLATSLQAGLDDVLIGSDFVLEQLVSDVGLINWLNAHFSEPVDGDRLTLWVGSLFESCWTEQQLMVELRRLRNRVQVGLIWHDLSRVINVWILTEALSRFADAIIANLIGWCDAQLADEFGVPVTSDEREPQMFAVLAMGKLGGEELNLSSDIDLIFVYDRQGYTFGGNNRNLSNEQYFTRLGQLLIKMLNTRLAEGFVFRVDMRLRPFGQSGPLVSSLVGFEKYYAEQGRDWERYAMLKSRVISNHDPLASAIREIVQPFVYRKYIDFSVVDGLRSMKRMMAAEYNDTRSSEDIKLGRGGIRELEFFVQAFQLIRGGQDSTLRQRNWLCGLTAIRDTGLITQDSFDQLEQAYVFLRNLEHRLQAIKDQQTQVLPSDDFSRYRVAWSMGYRSTEDFLSDLDHHRDCVYLHFEKVVGRPLEDGICDDHGRWALGKAIWDAYTDPEAFLAALSRHEIGCDVSVCLVRFVELRLLKTLKPIVLERLASFMAMAITAIAVNHYDAETVNNFLSFVESILRRSTYMVALIEHPIALEELLLLMSKSVWLSEKIIDQPFLVDELLDNKKLYAPLNREALSSDLQARLLRGADGDAEFVINSLRYFLSTHLVRIAASEVSELIPMMRVSDHLTWLAETVLQSAVTSAWRELARKYGEPAYKGGDQGVSPFIVVGYGKLGGYELSYSSDLDIVFLYEASLQGRTSGEKSIEDSTFYWKLAQKIIHYLSVRTKAGLLYEVDVRLRPSGNSGLLVSSLSAFEKYQLERAWTWEKQALVKARVVVGGGAPARRFDEIRRKVLVRASEQLNLKQDFVEMRDRMLRNLAPFGRSCSDRDSYCKKIEAENRFHVKHDPGGMVDIEFLVQYFVLVYAKEFSALLQYSDNIRLLDEVARYGIMNSSDAEFLQESYLQLRGAQHRMTLRREIDFVPNDEWSTLRSRVMDLWSSTFL